MKVRAKGKQEFDGAEYVYSEVSESRARCGVTVGVVPDTVYIHHSHNTYMSLSMWGQPAVPN